jgi:hypothetical protein
MKKVMVGRLGNGQLIRLFTVTLFVAMFAGSFLQAGDGKTPIWEATTLSSPGNYIVTRDIVTAAGPVLNILMENVTVDLNGFTLRTADPSAAVVRFAPPAAPADDPRWRTT